MSNAHTFLILCIFGTLSVIESYKFKFWSPGFRIETANNVKQTNVAQSSTTSNIMKSVTDEMLEEIFKISEQNMKERQELELNLTEAGRMVKQNSRRADSSLNRNRQEDPIFRKMELAHLPFEYATNMLYERLNLPRDVISKAIGSLDINGITGRQNQENCRGTRNDIQCDPSSKFRRLDGRCNNLLNPRWGSAGACQPRLLPPNYVGASGFRVSVDGNPLPRPRQLSLNVHNNFDRPTNLVTHMYMFFGQLLDHDITQTPQSTTIDNEAINCCPPNAITHPQCRPILISEDDPFYSTFNITCMNFVRSVPCPTCTLGPRQLMNQVTSTIDASFVYGNSENQSQPLRANDGTGRLRVQRSAYGDLLPQSFNPENDLCSFPESNEICFESGDTRVNQHTVLTSLHTIFLREHNRIASILRQLNRHWNEERLFQEARRIVGAEMQAITYKEFLPITLNDDRMTFFKLWLGSSTNYEPDLDPTTLIEFTTAAFRFGHSLINSIVANRPLNASNELRFLRNEFFQPFELYNGLIRPLMEGATSSPAQWFDRHLVPDVTDYLYRVRGEPTGLDLASININRGRDHGLPTYVDTVRYCSGGRVSITRFSDLRRYNLMQAEQVNVLRNNYRFVEDIDLWTGILNEIYSRGSVVGPTAACIIGVQFHNLKYGDRFYFEHRNQAGSFTYQQIQQLRKATLSRIICLNTATEALPRNAMIFSSNSNPKVNCRNMKSIDLSYWKE